MTAQAAPSVNGARWVLGAPDDWDELQDRAIHEERVPEFDRPGKPPAYVYLRAMTEGEREDWSLRRIGSEHYEPDPEKALALDRQRTWDDVLRGTRIELLLMSVVNQDGKRYLKDADVDRLRQRNPAVVARLYRKARSLNGLDAAETPESADPNPSTAAPSS